MRCSIVALVFAAFAGLTAAYTQPVGATPSGNPISKPGLNEIVPAGKPYTITWDPTTQGTVTIVLLRGPSTNIKPLYPIVEKIPNTGTYVWTPSTSLQADTTHYGIQLIDDATGAYQYSTQFGISNTAVTTTTGVVTQKSDGQPQKPTTLVSRTTIITSTLTNSVTKTRTISAASLTPSNSANATTKAFPTTTGVSNVTVTTNIGTLTLVTSFSHFQQTTSLATTSAAAVFPSSSPSPSPSTGAAAGRIQIMSASLLGMGALVAIFL
ncbi:MAG: hypothetical protein MMC33_008741 [Icmadophila ericetorum]|nr:hypothetical protein [Icmadophila ericetorum]